MKDSNGQLGNSPNLIVKEKKTEWRAPDKRCWVRVRHSRYLKEGKTVLAKIRMDSSFFSTVGAMKSNQR